MFFLGPFHLRQLLQTDDSRWPNLDLYITFDELILSVLSSDHSCTPSNFNAAAECVNQLNSRGYPAPLRFINNDKTDASKIINCIFAPLEQLRKDNEQQEVNNLHNQQSENGVLTTNIAKLKQQFEQSERHVETLRAKFITCEENLQKIKQNPQYPKTQYAEKEWKGRPANKKLLLTHEEMQERERELREKDEEIEKQRMKIEDLVTQLDKMRYVAEEQKKFIDRFLSGYFFQNPNEEEMLNMSGMELTIAEVDEEAASLCRMRKQLDQERRQLTKAAIKLGGERAALRAKQEAFEKEKRSLQTWAMLSSLSDTPYGLKSQQAGPVQSTPTQAASINSVPDFESWSPSASLEPSSNSKLSKNRMPHTIMESDTINTPTAIPMGASQHSRTAISTLRTSKATGATNPGSQFPKSALRSGSVRGNTTVAPRNAKRKPTIAADNIICTSFVGPKQLTMSINTASVGKSRDRSSRTEEVNLPRANKHPRLDAMAVQEGTEFKNNDTERKNCLRGRDAQPTRVTVCVSRRSSVVSRDVKENLKLSAPASQDRSGKMVSAGPSSVGQRKMQLLQSANAKLRATGAISPTPTSTSPRSLASVATKASRRQQFAREIALSAMTNLTCSTSSAVSSRRVSSGR